MSQHENPSTGVTRTAGGRGYTAVTAAALALLMSPAMQSAHAQEEQSAGGKAPAAATSAEAGEGLHEVVVTAQFREQSLQTTPLAITAVNPPMLEARSAADITPKRPTQAPERHHWAAGAASGPGRAGLLYAASAIDSTSAL